MLKSRLAKAMLLALAACAGTVATCGVVFADDDQTQALKEQMRAMQQQMQLAFLPDKPVVGACGETGFAPRERRTGARKILESNGGGKPLQRELTGI